MGEIVHTSRIRIVRENGPTRRAMIEGFDEPVYYGVHGGIKRFTKWNLKRNPPPRWTISWRPPRPE
jgi:hypothetical protein